MNQKELVNKLIDEWEVEHGVTDRILTEEEVFACIDYVDTELSRQSPDN